MILVTPTEPSEYAFQQAIVFADQLHAAGYQPVLDGANLTPEIRMETRFHALPYLRDITDLDLSGLIIIGAETNDPDSLIQLRQLTLNDKAPVIAFGNFETPQSKISATARLSYVLGRAPEMIALDDFPQIKAGSSICPSFGVKIDAPARPRAKPTVTIIVHDLEDQGFMNSLQYLTSSRHLNAIIYLSGRNKSEWLRKFQPGAQVYGFSEIGPTQLSRMSDILVMTGPIGNNHNALCLLNNHLMSGATIIDVTPDAEFELAGLPVHRGPADLAYLKLFLDETVLDGSDTPSQASFDTAQLEIKNILKDLPQSTKPPKTSKRPKQTIHFMPTNGVGLGHAQRSVLIAKELAAQKLAPHFFAFPSCLPMINKAGFEGTPLVPRSGVHQETAANDLTNYARLRTQMNAGDVFVFDGGYVFESVISSIMDKNLTSVWVRRGLWKAAQDNRVPLDREKFFDRVIVPQEAFADLNAPISSGEKICPVGPTVRQVETTKASKTKLITALKEEFSLDFERLVITMLGSGAVHDLSANVQSICANIEARDDCLNLIVNWPGAYVPSERYSWTRSTVVTTTQANLLTAHADLLISACGYNSFHESLYNKVPTIFVPQIAPSTDDQEARAEAAADLGLASHIPAGKLSKLTREVDRYLDEGKAETIKAALTAYEFPETGNTKAADLIREMMT